MNHFTNISGNKLYDRAYVWSKLHTVSTFLGNREDVTWGSRPYGIDWHVNTKMQAFYLDTMP